jgi:WhiB family transcriptional regulator, redox-sensing transcriptional regulator
MSVSVTSTLGTVDWAGRGACRTEDPDLFFPIASTGPALKQVARAKAICARCEVLAACLSYALETGQDCGVWGGTTEQERRAIRAGHMRAALRAQRRPALQRPLGKRRR